MKKLFCFLAIIATFGLINIPAFATEAPSYDSTYNSNTGAFFANGTPIVISEVDGNTVITWDGGSQIVPNTVSVFGGGVGGNYDSTQITMESGKIDGINYSVGNKDDAINSPNRTDIANIVISGGKITYGLFGGGQGYSYTGTVNLTISDGDLNGSYVTAGGSNGYTESANVKLTGGKIGVYQTVNRGTLNNATIKVAGSSIDKFYVGGEAEDKSVTGVINNINTHLISGNIENLDSGTSNGTPITIDDETYKVTATNSIKITNDNLGSSKSAIDYDFTVPTKNIKLFVNQNMKIEAIVTTNPTGYEDVFNDLFSYSVDDESVAVVSEDGIITGVSKGTTSVTIKNGEKVQTIDVTVTDLQLLNIFLLILVICTMAIFAILFAFLYLEIF